MLRTKRKLADLEPLGSQYAPTYVSGRFAYGVTVKATRPPVAASKNNRGGKVARTRRTSVRGVITVNAYSRADAFESVLARPHVTVRGVKCASFSVIHIEQL